MDSSLLGSQPTEICKIFHIFSFDVSKSAIAGSTNAMRHKDIKNMGKKKKKKKTGKQLIADFRMLVIFEDKSLNPKKTVFHYISAVHLPW